MIRKSHCAFCISPHAGQLPEPAPEVTLEAMGFLRSRPRDEGEASSLLAPRRAFDRTNPELIDRPEVDADSVREELQALERANRRLGGHHLILNYVARLAGKTERLTVLDLGTGLGDIPRAIVAWGRSREIAVTVTAVDVNPKVLGFAREACREWPEITIERENMLALPYSRGSFDLVLCSLALHHFETPEAIGLLRRIQEIARTGYVVNDLRRNWLAIASTEILTRTIIKPEIVRHDAAYSSRAAFTPGELRSMAERAGLKNYRIRRHHFAFRMVLEGSKT